MKNTVFEENHLHVCLICVEIFAWGKYGGFGRATRIIGRELVNHGIKVTAIVPRRQGQAKIEYLDGIRVIGFNLRHIKETLKVFQECDADIFHSEEPSLGTYLAQRYHPDKKHVVTFRDTRIFSDWITEFKLPSLNKLQVLSNWLFEDNFLVHYAVRKADMRFVAAKMLTNRAKIKYHLKTIPEFLPTPVSIPAKTKKDAVPTVCYVARWDRRKRPELVIELAKSHPEVNFIIAGNSRDKKYDLYIRNKMSQLPNIELTGFIDQFENDRLSAIFSRSWILINTAAREGLPNSFIEACAHHCALLSSVNPDEFSSSFGFYCSKDEFCQGLDYLLANEHWKNLSETGYKYVKYNFEIGNSIQKHLNIYLQLTKSLSRKEND